MNNVWAMALRRSVVTGLLLALALAGVWRGLAAAPDAPLATIAGRAVPICHVRLGDAPGPEDPANPARHDCCDDCALSAPAAMPAAPEPAAPTMVALPLRLGELVASLRHQTPARTPRQSQGPPIG